jgi:hypothetical protein
MYCEKCQTNVLTKREDLDIGIIIILFIFTAGLGVLIYLVVYYDKNSNRCIHCNSICKPVLLENQINKIVEPIKEPLSDMELNITENRNNKESKFCYNCGTKLDERERKFCSFCGVSVE